MTQQELNNRIDATFDKFDTALEKADTRRGYSKMTGMNTPSQNDVIQKFKNVFASLVARAGMFGLNVTNLNDAVKAMPEAKEIGILE